MHGVTEVSTDRRASGTSPGILNPISRTFEITEPTIWKFVPSGGRSGLPLPDTTRLSGLIGEILCGCIRSLMG